MSRVSNWLDVLVDMEKVIRIIFSFYFLQSRAMDIRWKDDLSVQFIFQIAIHVLYFLLNQG